VHDIQHIHIHQFEDARNQPVVLDEQREQEVFAVELLMPHLHRELLALRDRRRRVLCKFLVIHDRILLLVLYFYWQ